MGVNLSAINNHNINTLKLTLPNSTHNHFENTFGRLECIRGIKLGKNNLKKS